MAELAARVRLILRGREGALAAAETILGFSLPHLACRSHGAAGIDALWLGPDEWLLLAEDASLRSRLASALAPHPHALVDISHGQGALDVTGSQAAAMLNAGCPLDLSDAAFPVGACTRTVLGKAEIVLWRTAPQSFQVETARSFIPYVTALLRAASGG